MVPCGPLVPAQHRRASPAPVPAARPAPLTRSRAALCVARVAAAALVAAAAAGWAAPQLYLSPPYPAWVAVFGALLAGPPLLAVFGWLGARQSASGRLYITARQLLPHALCAAVALSLPGVSADLAAPSGGVQAAVAAGLAAAALHVLLYGRPRATSTKYDERAIEGPSEVTDPMPIQPQPSDREARPSGADTPALSLRTYLQPQPRNQVPEAAGGRHSTSEQGNRDGTGQLLRTTSSGASWLSAANVVYSSPYHSATIQLQHNASFETAAANLAAAARSILPRALIEHASGGGSGDGRPSGGGGDGAVGPSSAAGHPWRGHPGLKPAAAAAYAPPPGDAEPGQACLRTKVAVVRGCVELILWLQFDGEELGQDDITAAVAGAEAELARLAAEDERPHPGGGEALQGAAAEEKNGVQVAPAVLLLPAVTSRLEMGASPLVASGGGRGSQGSSPRGPLPAARTPSGSAEPAGVLAALGIDAQRDPIRAAPLLLALDPPLITAGTGGGGAFGTLNVSLCLDEGETNDPVEVRLVLQQRGAVVAEVACITVGPQGASASLDVSGLAEGSAALLVLPVWEDGPQMRPTTTPALLYVPLAVVSAPVAEELSGLFDSMEQAAAGKWPSAGPQARRALAYMQHFSPLLADMAPLLPGEAEGEQLGLVSGSGARRLAAGPARDVAGAAAGFLADRGMAETLRYLAAGLRSAGLDEVLGALAARGSSGGVSSARWASAASLLSDGDISAADAGPAVGDSAVPDPAAVEAAAEAVGHVEGGQAAAEERRRKQRATRVAAAGLACMARERLALAAAAVFVGFRDAGTERRCTRFRSRRARSFDAAAAAVNALLVLATLAAVAAWRSGAAVLGAAGPLPPIWAVVQLGLCVCALVLPAVLIRADKRLAEPGTREPFIWACHAVSMLLFCWHHMPSWGPGALGAPQLAAAPLAGPSSRALAALCTALQPASYSLRVKLRGPLFALDAALLTILFAAADGGTWCSGLPMAAAVVAASLAACALVDLLWRLRFLTEVSREVAAAALPGNVTR
ncbi:hypothetical protein HYH03_016545 [Edaphochlamys debaryana]|uniref:Uncharacterized protein n=1 Tax=Edaphochlamys debaryana TaxID=47281 RepID=A0A835XK84_9CHLO|nr:hypothetical protein HYH03_016545 [Edaphochlamys debaryana]|eukprot:KAG2484717.1 hypothetical protein HYH03_016545 [Edaphochlamys debaryana]